jgi:hypothetical protein
MKATTIDNILYDRDFVSSLRSSVITIRDNALKQNNFSVAVELSFVIAFMAYAIEQIEN